MSHGIHFDVFGQVVGSTETPLRLKQDEPREDSTCSQGVSSEGATVVTAIGMADKMCAATNPNVIYFNTLCNMTSQPCVFVVDDDEAIRDGLGLVVETLDLACQTFECAEQFLEGYCHGKPGCLLLDFNLPGMNGLELQAEMNRRKIQLPIIFLTAHGNAPVADSAFEAGAFAFLTKPVQIGPLVENIRAALRH
jgi:CheY-like chemotaxis protein